MQLSARYWAVFPAAVTGTRMGGTIPKQYLPLAGSTVIGHVLKLFLSNPRIAGISMAIADADAYWQHSMPGKPDKPLRTTRGGAQRAHSVLNVLRTLKAELESHDWVVVHDAVRPCLHADDLKQLLNELSQDAVGGILATPLVDTVKSVDENHHVNNTAIRHNLWRAFTPQMFRFGVLLKALEAAIQRGETPTDEACAMESAGHSVRVVRGRSDNIKITCPEDLALAEAILKLPTGAGL